jgi:dipicolinate synthase subunit A
VQAEAALAGADCVILPLPSERDGSLNAPFSAFRGAAAALLAPCAPGVRIFAGGAGEELRSACRRGGLPLTDLLRREDFALRNAELTAEGAVALLLQGDDALRGSEVLIAGFGRIGRRLAAKLTALGARVTVLARRPEDRALAELLGCRAVKAATDAPKPDAVVNTVPAVILGAPELSAFGNARLLELAGAPGGFDLSAAEALGKTVERCPGLPGKCAPRAAAKAIRDTIYSVLED